MKHRCCRKMHVANCTKRIAFLPYAYVIPEGNVGLHLFHTVDNLRRQVVNTDHGRMVPELIPVERH